MARREITYGVRGMIDWVARIPVGKAHLNIHFTGGVDSTYGNVPAEYATREEFVQQAIERSEYYKIGRIEKLREVVLEESRDGVATHGKGLGISADNSGAEVTPDKESREVKSFACLQDAQAWLTENYGIASRNIRSKSAAVKAAEDHGVELRFEN